MSEIEKIKKRYQERDSKIYEVNKDFIENMVTEREIIYKKILENNFSDFKKLSMIEIGAGGGSNLTFFLRAGFLPENIFANELMENRIAVLQSNFKGINVFPGNAAELTFKEKFDVVFQSTVFTSVLDNELRKKMACKMFEMLRPGGIILWYDFIFSTPWADYVKKVSKKEVKLLFPDAKKIIFYKVTIAPPIGRRVGKLYGVVNSLFPFLRTHIIAEIHK